MALDNPPSRIYPSTITADSTTQTEKIYSGPRPMLANGRSKTCRICSSRAMAYMEMPEEKTVINANENALNARVFSSNRNRRYSGTDRAREP